MREKNIESIKTYIQSTVERETNPVAVVVWRKGEAIRQKGSLAGKTVWSH
jgi:hypothetical protein